MYRRANYFAFTILIILFVFLSLLKNVAAQTDLYIRGSAKLIPIAVPQLCLSTSSSASSPVEDNPQREIPRVMSKNLSISGIFQVLESNSYVETPGKCGDFAYSDWSVIGSEGLIRGVVTATPSGVKVQMMLYDVPKQRMVVGKEYQGDLNQIKKIAHRFSNDVMQYFTGQPGVFGTEIVFSSKIGRFKELFVMNMNGDEVRQLTNDRSLSLSASWTRDGRSLFYTSYRKRAPELFRLELFNRKAFQLTQKLGLVLGARYSPDGSKLMASLSDDRGSDIVLLSPSSGQVVKRLTPTNSAIDVSPDWSPDGKQIVFCSSRSGGPQIYVMNEDGSSPRRISFVTANYCTSPRWSPKGDKIAFVCRADGGFQIFVTNPDGGDALQLTSVGDNEDPDWSPNGYYLTFSSTFWRRGVPSIAIMHPDGSGIKQLTNSRSGDSQPSWGPALQ
jgi:TolB protein